MKLDTNSTFGLPASLTIPIAAKSIEAIEAHVGSILERHEDDQWLTIDFKPLAPADSSFAWKEGQASWLNKTRQCWVEVDYKGYRSAYQNCYPELDLSGFVIDHIQNRRMARSLGFRYIRLMHVSRGVNSSSGRGEESNVIDYNNPEGLDAERFKESPHKITYADPADLLKMLNIKVGGFPLNNLRDHLHLFYG